MHGHRYFHTVWAAVLEQFFGDEAAAEKWMTSHCANLRGKPIELAQDAEGRNKILAETKIMAADRMRSKPYTAWRTVTAFYPSPYNGELLFRGTEIPSSALFSELSRGGTIHTFVRENPGVTREQVEFIFERLILDLCDF